MNAVAEYSESFFESDQSTYQERSAVTTDFNYPSEDYINFISADLSTQMMNTENDGQILDKASNICSNTNIIFSS